MDRPLNGGWEGAGAGVTGGVRSNFSASHAKPDGSILNVGSPGGVPTSVVGPGIGSEQINCNSEDLLVFGYECKLYRDDSKAEWIENGGHLIPWMGDSSVMIDRYDGRGLLTDLKHGPVSSALPSAETQIIDIGLDDISTSYEESEQLCEAERYLAMNDEEVDELTFHEIEFKRLQSAVSGIAQESGNYSSVGFNYDDKGPKILSVQVDLDIDSYEIDIPAPPKRRKSSHEVPFIPPAGLYIPPGMTMPNKMKVHAIIEKTAKFVANHGPQMEIIVKTKQAHNKQFNFLYYNDPLNEYYKNLLLAIKENLYKPSEETSSTQDDEDSYDGNSDGSENDEGDGGSGYLHPSLMKGQEAAKPFSFSMNYKTGTANSAYSILVSKIRKFTGTPASQDSIDQPPPPPYSQAEGYVTPLVEAAMFGQDNGYQSAFNYEDQTQQLPRVSTPEKRKPNSDEQVIIEKMASYVTKNGPAFESVAGTKGDPRFQFLDPFHPHHWYYLNCKKRFSVEASAVVASGNPIEYNAETTTTTGDSTRSTTITMTTASTATSTTNSLKANHANAASRLATLPPDLINKIEELRKKTQQNKLLREAQQQEALAEKKPVIKFSSSLANLNIGGINAAGINTGDNSDGKDGKSVPPTLVSYAADDVPAEPSDTYEGDLNSQDSSKLDPALQSEAQESQESDSSTSLEPVSRKEERRRKAALFLQRLKRSSPGKENTSDPQTDSIKSNEERLDVAAGGTIHDLTEKRVGSCDVENQDNLPERLPMDSGNTENRTEVLAQDADGSPNDAMPDRHSPISSEGEIKEVTPEPGEIVKRSSGSSHRKRRRSRSRSRDKPRSGVKPKRKRSRSRDSDSSVILLEDERDVSSKSPKRKSHRKKKHNSRIDDSKRWKKSPKKKKKHHKSSKKERFRDEDR